jgi:solute carrier family 12 (potassium/chloride transporters), member 9
VRKYLLRIDARKQHIKNWRLQVLLLVSNPRTSLKLMDFVNSMKKGGLYIVGNVQVGSYRSLKDSLSSNYDSFLDLFNLTNIKAFPEITFGESVQTGIQHLINNSGIGIKSLF